MVFISTLSYYRWFLFKLLFSNTYTAFFSQPWLRGPLSTMTLSQSAVVKLSPLTRSAMPASPSSSSYVYHAIMKPMVTKADATPQVTAHLIIRLCFEAQFPSAFCTGMF